jgi:hypothetical protein
MSRTQSWHGARLPYEPQDLGALAFTGALVGEARRKVPMTRAQPEQQPRLAGTAHARHLARQRSAECSSKRAPAVTIVTVTSLSKSAIATAQDR